MDVDMDTHNNKYAHNGKVLLGSATFLFFMFTLVIFLHTHSYSRRRHNRHLFPTATADTHTALEPSLFNFLPTFTYSSATGLHLQECAVCLSEFEEGEDGCILPNCNHFFHTHCIDTWFRTHSNCPICRALVQPPQVSPQITQAGIPGGGFAGCSHLPPPMPCRRKELDLDMLSVIVEARKEETSENTMSWESGSPGDTGLKTPDDGVWKGTLEGAGSGKAVTMWIWGPDRPNDQPMDESALFPC